jgi:hypothetical protein
MELIERRELAGGMVVMIHDESKPVAGDRWLVRIRCEATMPLPLECARDLREEDPDLKAMVLARLGETLAFVAVKERNFIDDREKEGILAGMVESVRQNVLTYLMSPRFPARLFASRYAELRANCLIERQYLGLPAAHDEDEGPADFSALFRG